MEKLLWDISVILAIIILHLVLRKRIGLLLIRLLYGKYSRKYIERFKKLTRTNPFPYCLKAEIYSQLHIFRQRRGVADTYTAEGISAFENHPFGTEFMTFLKKEHRPYCYNIVMLSDHEIRIAGYRREKFGFEALARFYFLDGRFFMGDYFYKKSPAIDPESISRNVLKEFGISESQGENEFFIQSKHCTVYFGDNGFDVQVKFLENDNKIINGLLNAASGTP